MSANSLSKSKLHGLWALTNRELKKWYKAPVIFIITIIQPVIWMGLLGKAMNLGALIPSNIPGIDPQEVLKATLGTGDYFSFMAVGMITFTVLFTTMFSGMSVVWDRRLGFLNKVLSTPVSRSVIVLSKVFSATLRSMFQAAIIITVALLLGLKFGEGFSPLNILGVFSIIFLVCMGLSSLFIAVNVRSTRWETPMAVMNLINLPLMFASNALFPINYMPDWLQAVANVNPLSYMTDAVRQLLIFNTDYTQLAFDFAYVGIFAAILTTIGIVLSWRFLNK
ncbi:MAG: ABC transporter permease [Candidatus Bathyarchaeota archaeon]|nr:MAG: ABC transporter permease [Candidatus Bathyarchaeota archaeon]